MPLTSNHKLQYIITEEIAYAEKCKPNQMNLSPKRNDLAIFTMIIINATESS